LLDSVGCAWCHRKSVFVPQALLKLSEIGHSKNSGWNAECILLVGLRKHEAAVPMDRALTRIKL